MACHAVHAPRTRVERVPKLHFAAHERPERVQGDVPGGFPARDRGQDGAREAELGRGLQRRVDGAFGARFAVKIGRIKRLTLGASIERTRRRGRFSRADRRLTLSLAGVLACLDGYMNIAMEQTEVRRRATMRTRERIRR